MTAALTLDQAAQRCAAWFLCLRHQGVDLTDNAHLKVLAEACEFAAEPSLEEGADVFISLLGALAQRGWTAADLQEAVQRKMDVNEARTWARKADGTYQHV